MDVVYYLGETEVLRTNDIAVPKVGDAVNTIFQSIDEQTGVPTGTRGDYKVIEIINEPDMIRVNLEKA